MSKKKKILVVDDEHSIADSLAAILGQRGLEVYVAYSGITAIELAEKTMPDLLLSDVMMPDKNGIEVARHVRRKVPGCKILLLSGSMSAVDRLVKADPQGCDWQILAKPIHPKDLLIRLEALAA